MKVDPLDILSVAFPYPEMDEEFQEDEEIDEGGQQEEEQTDGTEEKDERDDEKARESKKNAQTEGEILQVRLKSFWR